jgi:hypothetical protein
VFAEIAPDIDSAVASDTSEAETRFHFIDRILIEVLGWSRDDITVEPPSESGYTDYLLRIGGINRFVIEAKRSGKTLIDTIKATSGEYKVGGPALSSCRKGIEQARRYCFEHSVEYAAVTTAGAWVAFFAFRPGIATYDGQAIVFPTVDAIIKDFARFYDLFSREGIAEKRYLTHINRAEGRTVQAHVDWQVAVPEIRVHLRHKSPLALDLDRMFDRFFRSLTDENDLEMLRECFVETRESRHADSALQKIARDLIAGIISLDSPTGGELAREIESAVRSMHAEIVLIIGNKGAGKSTFIDRFFEIVLARDVADKCLVLRANLGGATFDVDEIEGWLTHRLVEQAENAFFRGQVPTYDDLQGIFFADYQRWSTAEMKYLYESDKVAFKIRFGEYIMRLREDRPLEYLARILESSVRQRLRLPCIVFDNADQFPQAIQQRVFQYAHALKSRVPSFTIVPITDRTVWQLSKHGPLQSYATKSFYLPVPSVKQIIEKRLAFLKRKLDGKKEAGQYFLSRGIKLSLKDLNGFAVAVERVFLKNDFVSKRVGRLANYDIRRSLELTRQVVSSPVLAIDHLVSAFVSGEMPATSEKKVVLALVQGENTFYNSGSNSFVANVFEIPNEILSTPLLGLRVLRYLQDFEGRSADVARQYVDLNELSAYFARMGIAESDVLAVLAHFLDRRLVEPYDPGSESLDTAQRVRLAPAGREHIELALYSREYVCQMGFRTPLRREATVRAIAAATDPLPTHWSAWAAIADEFMRYCIAEDEIFVALPADESYQSQRILRVEMGSWLLAKNRLVVRR